MANGQIKGAGNVHEGARIGYMKKFDVVLILLLVLQVLLAGCGDDDPTDEWIGTWALEMWDGENYKISREADFKEGFLKGAGSVEVWDILVDEFKVTVEFTFEDDSRWEFVETGKLNMSSKWDEIVKDNPDAPYVIEFLKVNKMITSLSAYISTGSYIVTDDEFIMEGDKRNTVFTGRMSGLWKRSGSKLTLFGDDKSRSLGTIVLSK